MLQKAESFNGNLLNFEVNGWDIVTCCPVHYTPVFSLRNKSLGDSILLQYIICFHRRSALSEDILKTFLASVDAFQRNDIEK